MQSEVGSISSGSVTTVPAPKKDKKRSRSQEAVEDVATEALASPSTTKKAKELKLYEFTPTEASDADWVTKPVVLPWGFETTFNLTRSFITGRLTTEEGKEIFKKLVLSSHKTYGDLEIFAISILKVELTGTEKQKEKIHSNVKEVLKTGAEKGITSVIFNIKSILNK